MQRYYKQKRLLQYFPTGTVITANLVAYKENSIPSQSGSLKSDIKVTSGSSYFGRLWCGSCCLPLVAASDCWHFQICGYTTPVSGSLHVASFSCVCNCPSSVWTLLMTFHSPLGSSLSCQYPQQHPICKDPFFSPPKEDRFASFRD